MSKIKILIVDDSAIVRQGLRTFLELQDDFEIVGEGVNGMQAVELTEQHHPDVVLLDLVMPQMDGVEATKHILSTNPAARILILSSFSSDDEVFPVIRAGAMGYLLKNIPPDDLADAIRNAYRGQAQLHPDIAQKLMMQVREPASQKTSFQRQLDELTERELDVLRLLAEGLSNQEIAQNLSISHKTVKTHVSNVLSKLDLADRTQAAIFAIKAGLAPDTE